MKLPFAVPDPAGTERAQAAKTFRDLATEISRTRPHALTRDNGEEADHGPKYPANFTKGLKHDEWGLVENDEDYRTFVEAINSPDRNLFESRVESALDRAGGEAKDLFDCRIDDLAKGDPAGWRGWESPRSGHVFELEGPDAGSVGMAPAPRVGSSELSAEMAEVYGLALLRDVPFTTICQGGGKRLCASEDKPGSAQLSAKKIVALLDKMPFYSGKHPVSSTPGCTDATGLNRFERNRRFARTLGEELTPENAFRGSTPGALKGPYISQFMLIGATSLAGADNASAGFPGRNARFGLQDGFIPYGSLSIDQRTLTHKNCLDHMTDWSSWLDVQNGANLKGFDEWEPKRRFITTPRDLATYVHFDALYEAYLNACLILLGMRVPTSKGFPEPSPSGRRDAFATFGGPHILSLVTEVATRCLKAVRRQKFNYHRRARPEAMGGRLTLVAAGLADQLIGKRCAGQTSNAKTAFECMLEEIPSELLDAVMAHNAEQNLPAMRDMRRIKCPPAPKEIATHNLLLPMAFPEGSPMHPAYGAGHATVAGGCVTMLKAFFEMFDSCDGGRERELRDANGDPIVYVPNANGNRLHRDRKFKGPLTIQGELDKLAANISIGRNMAGVHYYSDYYDSARMGERIAVGILLEQAPTYGDAVEVNFKSFDGDLVTLSGEAGAAPSLSVIDRDGNPTSRRDWWLRHVPGEEAVLDL